MGSEPIDPLALLKALDCFLGKDGEVKAVDVVTKIFSLMKDSRKMVSRCIYLNVIQQTRSPDILAKFIDVGGYKLLNTWLTYSKSTGNSPLLQQILITLHTLPLTVDHLKLNNTAKIVKQLSKSSEDEEVRRLAAVLVDEWMGMIRSQSNAQPAEKEKKKKREDIKSRSPVHERIQVAKPEVKTEVKEEDTPEKRKEKEKEKPKIQRTTAPSHAKFRSTGLEMEPPAPALGPAKKNINTVVISDKYNIKLTPIKRQSSVSSPPDPTPAEKKYKPLNTTPNATKEIKVKIIPAQPMESLGFLDALNSAPIQGVKIKKKKKALSPTSNKPSPFELKLTPEAGDVKPPSPDPLPAPEAMEVEQPTTPVPAEEIPEPMETAPEPAVLVEARPLGPPVEVPLLTKKGRKKKTVTWCEEINLRQYYYFDMDETERVNVNKIKDFGEAAKREKMKDREAFETARRLSHDSMEETIPWSNLKVIEMTTTLVHWGSSSHEKFTQAEREKLILQEIFLSKDSVPDSPHEPDPESYEPIPPKLIPLDEESSMEVAAFQDATDQGSASVSPDGASGAKLPPVLANLMGSMGAAKGQSMPSVVTAINPLNVQEILTSIMQGAQGNPKPEELLKQPDFSDKIKQLLGSLQSQPPIPPGAGVGLIGPPLLPNGFPPVLKNMPHFPPGVPMLPFQGPPPIGPGVLVGSVGPMGPGCPGGPIGPGGPVGPVPGGPPGPRMMGPPLPMPPPPPPPPPPQHDGFWEQSNENMRGGPHGGMRGGPPFHRGRGQGGDPNFRGRGRGGPPNTGRGGHERGHRGHDRNRDRSHDRGGHDRGGHGHDRGHDRGYDGSYDGGHDHDRGHDRGYDGSYDGGHDRGYDGHGCGRGRGRGHGKSHGDMSTRSVCRHFMMKGNCRYEHNCAFYHPGVNGPHLP